MLLFMTRLNKRTDDTWQPLSLATRRLLKLDEQQNEHRECDPQSGRSDEEKSREERAYIEQRLEELRRWERRIEENRLRIKRR
jgi:hypothetical protein